MRKPAGIYTIRDTPHPHYWDIIYEWEDYFASVLEIPLIPVGKKYDQIYSPGVAKKILNRLNAFQLRDQYLGRGNPTYIAFHIGPPGVYSFYSARNVVPIIVDFWKHENLKRFESIFRLNPIVFITSLEVLNFLRDSNVKLPLAHLALSLPDNNIQVSSSSLRDIDVIQLGRSNKTLDNYMVTFLKSNPTIHYVSAKKINNQMQMFSNQLGSLGRFETRLDFLNLLRRSKISLVSSPGLDDDKIRTGGFSPVTPRFLESASSGCKLLGIYPDNADFDFYGISKVCLSVNSYTEFELQLKRYLSDSLIPDYKTFLQSHLSSTRAKELLIKITKSNG